MLPFVYQNCVFKVFMACLISVSLILTSQSSAHAQEQMQSIKSSVWESLQIKDQVVSLAYGDANQDHLADILYITPKALVLTTFFNGEVHEYSRKKFGTKYRLHRVSLGDWNHDGLADVLINGFAMGQAFSEIYNVIDNKFVRQTTWDSLVLPLGEGLQARLYSQVWQRQGAWSPVATPLVWQGKAWQSKKTVVKINQGLQRNELSLYHLTLQKNKWIYLTPDQKLIVKDKAAQKIWKSSMNYGGSVDYTELNTHDPLGVSQNTKVALPPRMAVQGPNLFVMQNEGYLKSVVGAVPNIKSSSLIKLEWIDNQGFQERYTSSRYNGAMSDMQIVDIDQDGQNELLVAFWNHQAGYVDAYKGQGSRLVILPLP